MKRNLNLGILAHVDAGKTSLTERLLYTTGAIQTIGSVDQGNTQTDSLAQERRRGITIQSAVASFTINDINVNLVDTPGHPDFIAEIERVLNVLDGAVMVISAVEGVQAQTRKLMRTLQRLKLPTLIFINKIDRRGAQTESLLQHIREKLTQAIIPMGSAQALGQPHAEFTPYAPNSTEFVKSLAECLAEHNDDLLVQYLDSDTGVPFDQLYDELATQAKHALIHPVFFGSAITGAGVELLLDGIAQLLPAPQADVDCAPVGTIFKVERGQQGEKVAYVRLFSGSLHVRDRLMIREHEQKVTAISVFERGDIIRREAILAGQIGKLWGLTDACIGDTIGALPPSTSKRLFFTPPTLETAIEPCQKADKIALYNALSQLAEYDPLINLRRDTMRHTLFVSLYGEVQKEVIKERLASDFGIEVSLSETTTVCIERPIGSGTALETAPNPFTATIGLRIEPAPIGTGIDFQLEVQAGSLPTGFFKAVEDSVKETLNQGLYGWQVTDCKVTMTDSIRYRDWATSTAADHRKLTPLVLMSALKQAGTQVYEPIHSFQLEVPMDTLSKILPVLASMRAVITHNSASIISGLIPAAYIHEFQRLLPGHSHGEGLLETEFDHYQPVTGTIPCRPRSDHNPLNRKEYLLHVLSHVRD
ncbi:MAG: translation factor GTPase family protein [Pseudomonadota bacterium]